MVDALTRASILIDLGNNHLFVCFPTVTAPFDIVAVLPDMQTTLRLVFISEVDELMKYNPAQVDGGLLKLAQQSATSFIRLTSSDELTSEPLNSFHTANNYAPRRRQVSKSDEIAIKRVMVDLIAQGAIPFVPMSDYVPFDLIAYNPQEQSFSRLRIGSGAVQAADYIDFLVIYDENKQALRYISRKSLKERTFAIQLV